MKDCLAPAKRGTRYRRYTAAGYESAIRPRTTRYGHGALKLLLSGFFESINVNLSSSVALIANDARPLIVFQPDLWQHLLPI